MTEGKPRNFAESQRLFLMLQMDFSLAAGSNRLDQMKSLLDQTIEFPDGKKRGLKIDDLGNRDGQAALHHAALNDALDAARFLLDHGAKINVLNDGKRTPLHMAGLSRKSGTTAAFLIAQGADVMARDSIAKTPLHLAGLAGSLDVAGVLLDRGADLHARDGNDDEPLHSAVRGEKIECVKFFFERGNYSADDKMEARFKARGLAEQHKDRSIAAYLDGKESEIEQRRKDAALAQKIAKHQKNLQALDKMSPRRPKGPDTP